MAQIERVEMTPEIIDRDEFIVVGVRGVQEKGAQTADTLWKDQFLPRHNEVAGADHCYYGVFSSLPGDQAAKYEYVAGMIGSLDGIPTGMVGWVIPQGRHAQVEARGLSNIAEVCRQLITDWLPDSGYRMADSPIFAYTRSEHPDSPDAIWHINLPIETPEELEELKRWQI